MIDLRAELRSLEAFYWVAKLQNFHHAAGKLRTTQPAISHRIAQLEGRLGGLIVRDRRPFVLTGKGEVVFAYAERLLRLHGEMIEEVSDPASLRGRLRLGVAETIVHTWLPRFLERMSAAYPRIVLEIDVDITANLRERLLGQSLDLAFMVGPISAAAIRNRLLGRERLAFLASPKLGLPRRTSLAAIARHPLITYSRNTQPYVNLAELFSSPSFARPLIHASASVYTIVTMALEGRGVAVLPPSVARREIEAGRLVALDCKDRLPDLQFVAGWLATPNAGIVERVAEMAAEVAGRHEKAARGDRKPRR